MHVTEGMQPYLPMGKEEQLYICPRTSCTNFGKDGHINYHHCHKHKHGTGCHIRYQSDGSGSPCPDCIPYKEEPVFKAGDRAEITSGAREGETVTINYKCFAKYCWVVKFEDGSQMHRSAFALRLLSPEPPSPCDIPEDCVCVNPSPCDGPISEGCKFLRKKEPDLAAIEAKFKDVLADWSYEKVMKVFCYGNMCSQCLLRADIQSGCCGSKEHVLAAYHRWATKEFAGKWYVTVDTKSDRCAFKLISYNADVTKYEYIDHCDEYTSTRTHIDIKSANPLNNTIIHYRLATPAEAEALEAKIKKEPTISNEEADKTTVDNRIPADEPTETTLTIEFEARVIPADMESVKAWLKTQNCHVQRNPGGKHE